MESSAGSKAAQVYPHLSTHLGYTNISIPADFNKLKPMKFYFLFPFWEEYYHSKEHPV